MRHNTDTDTNTDTAEWYDPRRCGARCDACPLGPDGVLRRGEWRPMPPDAEPGPGRADPPAWAVVIDAPTLDDLEAGYILSGREGGEWRDGVKAAGKQRGDFAVIPVIACVPQAGPGEIEGHWQKMEARLQRIQGIRKQRAETPLVHPVEACRARFEADLAPYANVITLDKVATKAVTGSDAPIASTCGDLVALDRWGKRIQDDGTTVPARRVVPTVSPFLARAKPKWRPAFRAHIAKAVRWFESRLNWTDPVLTDHPTPSELDAWLSVPAPFHVYDIETDGILTETTLIRCIAVATPDARGQVARAVGLILLDADDKPVHDEAAHAAYLAVFRKHMLDPDKRWVGHNVIRFDNAVLMARWGFAPPRVRDTMFACRAANPDFPKGLKIWGRLLTDVPKWETTEKGESLATGAVTPQSRMTYCQYDTVVNARVAAALLPVAKGRGMFDPLDPRLQPEGWPADLEWNIWNVDHEAQRRAQRMHDRGIWIDQNQRAKLVKRYTVAAGEHERIVVDIMRSVGQKYSNPGSYGQIRDILYREWDLGIPHGMEPDAFFTDSGLPGTDDNVLRAWMVDPQTNEMQRTFIYHLRLLRRYQNKVLGTVLLPLDPHRLPSTVADLGEMTEAEQEELDLVGGRDAFVWPDGRVRSSWAAHNTSVGRYSSSSPNIQNVGNKKGAGPLKSIFAASPGCILIGMDLNQAHLYIAAATWGIDPVVDLIRSGADVHGSFAYALMGDGYAKADGWGPRGFDLTTKPKGGMAAAMRNMTKTFRYAWIYWAGAPTIHAVMRSTEDDPPNPAALAKRLGRAPQIADLLKASMPYIDIPLAQIQQMDRAAHRAEPQWADAWERMLRTYKRQGYLAEPVFGRRSGDLDGGKKQAVVNYPVLAAESSIMRIVEHRVEARFPDEGPGGGRGLIHQCHDSVTVEVRLPHGYSAQDHLAWVEEVKCARGAGKSGPPLHPELEEKRRLLEDCANVQIPGWPVTIAGEADVGLTLKDV